LRKKLFAILGLVVLIAVLVPSCTPAERCTIEVKATLCDDTWEGLVNYTLTPGSGSPVTGTEVPATFNVTCGDWTCDDEDVSGGPDGAYLVDITSSETGGKITFTLNFELDQDAGIEFLYWTVDADPVEVEHEVIPCQIIDVHFQQWVDGCEGRAVNITEESELVIHYVAYEGGAPPPVWLYVVNDDCAVVKDPDPLKKWSQVPSFNGEPVEPGGEPYPLPFNIPTLLDVETAWELEKEIDYTKSINWLGISLEPGMHDCVLFDLLFVAPGVYHFMLVSSAEVALVDDEDVNLTNNSAESPPLHLIVFVAP
jgi:hypothetical protein